jgi:autotransporter adhesin
MADEEFTVSVGTDSAKRRITHLKDGENDDDAATYGQLSVVRGMVDDNAMTLTSHANLITNLTTRVDSAENDITDLTNRVDTLENAGAGSGPGTGSDLVSPGTAPNSLRVGDNADASAPNAIAIGPDASATNDYATSLGAGSRAEGSTAVGGLAEALGADSAAFGVQAHAHGDQSTAIGEFSTASQTGSSAFGTRAQATADNAVALGAASVADRANSVSVGSAGNERQITNVAAGEAATDAVNVAQLDSRIATVDTSIAVNSADIELLRAGVAGDGERFLELEAQAQDNTETLATVSGTVSENQARIARNSEGITANANAISTLNTNFEQLDLRVDALTNHIRRVNNEIDENTAGIAIANALAGSTWLQSNERVAFSANGGYYDGNSAVAFSGAARLSNRFSANLAVGTVPTRGDLGARAGVRFGF